MSEIYNVYEAKTRLSQLLARVINGKEVVIAKAGKPSWKIVPFETKKPKRIPGRLKGKIWYSQDCFSPITQGESKDWYGKDLPSLKK